MRADAAHNRELIIAAARELFLERGPEVPLDHIAQRAGVSIATLYRRFPERIDLIKAIVLEDARHVMDLIEHGIDSLADGGFGAWENCIQSIVAVPNAELMPAKAAATAEDLAKFHPEAKRTHQAMEDALTRLIAAAQNHGLVDTSYSVEDVGMFLFAAARTIPFLPREHQGPARQRFLHVIVSGLRPEPTLNAGSDYVTDSSN